MPVSRIRDRWGRVDDIQAYKLHSPTSLRISRLRVCLILLSFAETWISHDYQSYDRTRHVHAHHYCTHLSPDFHQCVIYDSDERDAKLIGIEYIVSEKVHLGFVVSQDLSQSPVQVFETFPMEEKKFWHSHKYEVR